MRRTPVPGRSLGLRAVVAAATLLSALLACDAYAQQVEGNPFSGFTAELNGLQVGGLYSVDLGEGYFRVVKVLALNRAGVHVLVHGNRFPARPSEVDPAALDVRPRGDPRGWGIHHLPLAWDLFISWQPNFIQSTEVTAAEREPFEDWIQVQGGIWSLSGMEVIRKLLSEAP
jgi:hypothetical protein